MFKIAYYRKKAGLNQSELAEKANITVKHLSNLETGRSLGTVKTLMQIAKELNVHVRDLFDE